MDDLPSALISSLLAMVDKSAAFFRRVVLKSWLDLQLREI